MGISSKLFGLVVASAKTPLVRGASSSVASFKFASNLQHFKAASSYSKLFGLASTGNKATATLLSRKYSTEAKGDQQLAEFLNEEIATEKKVQKMSSAPSTLGKFNVTLDEGRLVLKASHKDET